MNLKEIMGHVDHTLLNPLATWEEVEKLCEEAINYKAASVCIPPSYVTRVRENYKDLTITVVVGFPLGYQSREVKVFESMDAIEKGADEIDMVINLTDVKNGQYEKITDEIKEIKEQIGNKVLKVIVETCYLTEEEKIAMCKCVSESGADYIKTSTGFGSDGATFEDIKLFKKHLDGDIKIKAAGGIRSKEDMEEYIKLGCDRLGTSSAIKILYNKKN